MNRILSFIKRAEKYFTIIIIAVPAIWAAIWAYHEYRTVQYNRRVANSMKYVEHYNKSEVLAARYAIWGPWLKPNKLMWLRENKDDRDKWNEETEQFITQNELYKEFYILLNFFNEIGTCVNNRLCDTESACSMFYGDAMAFWGLLYFYLERINCAWQDDVYNEIKDFLFISCQEWSDREYQKCPSESLSEIIQEACKNYDDEVKKRSQNKPDTAKSKKALK